MSLVVILIVTAVVALLVSSWSIIGDLRIYRAWKLEQSEPQPRWKRRRKQKEQTNNENDGDRWRWLMLALKCAVFGIVVGGIGVTAGYVMRVPWLLVSGGNLVFLGIAAWAAYNVLLPKPRALKEKPLPAWLQRK